MDEITIKIASNGYLLKIDSPLGQMMGNRLEYVFHYTEDLLLCLIDKIPHYSKDKSGDEVS